MVLGALGLLLALGFADPGNVRLMPSIKEHFANLSANLLPALGLFPDSKGKVDEEGIQRAIAEFNRKLSLAYLELNPGALTAYPMDERLRRTYIEEIDFLQQDGRVLDLTAQDIRIKQVSELPNLMWSVDTLESVKVRYLKATDRTEIVAYPQARYAMNYTLEKSGADWKIAAIETMSVGSADE
jgi:hypothetical protein